MGRKILVIEDDQSVALMLGTALRLAGYEVVTAPDAVVARSRSLVRSVRTSFCSTWDCRVGEGWWSWSGFGA